MKGLVLFVILGSFIYFNGMSQGCLPEGITLTNQLEIDNFPNNYPDCNKIIGAVTITGLDITNLNGLNQIESIGGSLYISQTSISNMLGLSKLHFLGNDLMFLHNNEILSLEGLENITNISGFVSVNFCTRLINLKGLDNLVSVLGTMLIHNNSSLETLEGLNNLKSLKNDLSIATNDVLISIESLGNVTFMGDEIYIIGNNSLASLKGLDNVNAILLEYGLYIQDNASLSMCEVKSVCDYLAIPESKVVIEGNAQGCNNVSEVEEACKSLSIEDKTIVEDVLIFPCPAQTHFNIQTPKYSEPELVTVYNLYGQKVAEILKPINPIDISHFLPGLYLVELEIGKKNIRKMLIVE